MNDQPNHLAAETSPYLLQHAHNPVDWYPWGKAALERARSENRPIFLSVGYAACHWCHVMERESFENAAIAAVLNEHFVSIKVDREERPDLDEIYMTATVALSGSGGWPMSVFLTPEQKPFFAGTYFPPDARYGRPGFLQLLQRIAELWRGERSALEAQARELTAHVQARAGVAQPSTIRGQSIARAVEELAREFDPKFGGFGGAPKFPPHQGLRLLMRHYAQSGDAHALEMLNATLSGMKNGGIYDHIGGGFARYSTDARWLVPHFEKMLYDNAQLAQVYLEAFQLTGDTEYERVARETLDYVVREMQGENGGYFSATDADSEGEEGKFFVFLPEEVDEILGKDDAEAFCLYYDVSVEGNWEGKNVLNTPRPLAVVASELGTSPAELSALLARSREKVYAARKLRVPPLLDDKVIAAWNGLMIEAMADGYRVLREPRYLASARRAAEFVRDALRGEGGALLRTARAGKAHIPAFLEDYAFVTDALITLYEVSGEAEWLAEAQRLSGGLLREFSADDGSFYSTSSSQETLIARFREGFDGALPNANAVAARALWRLSRHLDEPALAERARRALLAHGALVERAPRALATALAVVDSMLSPPLELVVVGAPGAADTEAIWRGLARHYVPNRVLAFSNPAAANETPLARGKTPVNGAAALYICRDFACEAPLTSPELIAERLASERGARSPEAELVLSNPRS